MYGILATGVGMVTNMSGFRVIIGDHRATRADGSLVTGFRVPEAGTGSKATGLSWLTSRELRATSYELGMASMLGACTVAVTPSTRGVVYVRNAPPVVIAETPGPRSGPAYFWDPGHWRWNGYKYGDCRFQIGAGW
jgi:hypothetical protein